MMTSRRLLSRRLPGALLLLGLAGASGLPRTVAEIRVRAVDRRGSGIAEAEVWVGGALEPGEARGSRPWRMKPRGVTDERGELVVPLAPGRWQVEARFNPLQPPPVVTLRERDESRPVDVVAREGGLVVFEPEVDGLESRHHLIVRARHLDAPGEPIDVEMRELQELVLPTGDWVFEPVVPGGHVLARFLVDGRPDTKTRVEPTQVGLFVQSLLVADARIVIDMRWIDEKARPTPMSFTPLEPGELMREESSRWRPPDDASFGGRALNDNVYRASSIVPAGTWGVAPRQGGVVGTPETHEVTIPPGGSGRIEFALEFGDEIEDRLHVRVHGSDYRRSLEGARVWLCRGGSTRSRSARAR